jgi:DNA-binding MarR family transcriptional regulator
MSATLKQKQILEFLIRYFDEQGQMPNFDEIAEGVNLASKSGIARHLDNLEQRGFIKRLPFAARSIELTAKARGQQKTREELQAEIERLRAAEQDKTYGGFPHLSDFSAACLDYVSDFYDVTPCEVMGRGRTKDKVQARQELMVMLRLAGYSTPEVGRNIGRRDHTTILHAEKAVAKKTPDRLPELKRVTLALVEKHGLTEGELTGRDAAEHPAEKSLRRERVISENLRRELSRLKRRLAELELISDRADRAYGVNRLRERIDDLEAENEWLRANQGRKVAA